MRKCYKCKQRKELEKFCTNRTMPLDHAYICITCNRMVGREYSKSKKGTDWARAKNRRWYERRRLDVLWRVKSVARYTARYALLTGKIKKGVCISCGGRKYLQMHHLDYDKPLEILWLCRECHKNLHLDLLTHHKGGKK